VNHIRAKLTVASLAIAAAVGVLAFTGVREGWVYYLSVDEFLADASRHQDRIRLHGRAGVEGFESAPGLLQARFQLVGETGHVPVLYSGVVPDMLQADRDVVVEGRLDEAGVFQADILLTKCASKYETADGQAPHAAPARERDR
jgi:cytochrome c-type biogenesis protein CcmE